MKGLSGDRKKIDLFITEFKTQIKEVIISDPQPVTPTKVIKTKSSKVIEDDLTVEMMNSDQVAYSMLKLMQSDDPVGTSVQLFISSFEPPDLPRKMVKQIMTFIETTMKEIK